MRWEKLETCGVEFVFWWVCFALRAFRNPSPATTHLTRSQGTPLGMLMASAEAAGGTGPRGSMDWNCPLTAGLPHCEDLVGKQVLRLRWREQPGPEAVCWPASFLSQERAGALRRAGIFPGPSVALFSGLPLYSQTGSPSGKGCAHHWLPEGPTAQSEVPGAVRAQGSTPLWAPELISLWGSLWPREPVCNNNRTYYFWSLYLCQACAKSFISILILHPHDHPGRGLLQRGTRDSCHERTCSSSHG